MATAAQALASLDADYQQRRQALLAEQQASQQRQAELAQLSVTQQEAAAHRQQVEQAQTALDRAYTRDLEPLIADLANDCHLAQQQFAQHWNEIAALIKMAEGFQQRAEALAHRIGHLAQANEMAFDGDNNDLLDYVRGKLSYLPSASDLNIAPSDLIQTDTARLLGIRVVNQNLLSRSYNGRVASGLAAGRREAAGG